MTSCACCSATPPPRRSEAEVAGATDRGTVRSENQDAWHAVVTASGRASIVLADGMGGHAGGRESAEAAVDAAASALEGADAQPRGDAVRNAVAAANRAVSAVRDLIGGNPGTTLVLALVDADGQTTVGNVGDSRAYVVSGADIRAISEDHSWVGEQVREGLLDPLEARRHPRRNIITRAVMGDPVDADVYELTLGADDLLLLCSDGVWEPLSDAALGDLARAPGELEQVMQRLCVAALEAGSRDNVTAVAAKLG